MTRRRGELVAALGFLLALVATNPALAQGPPALPTPGPEHAVLKEEAGTWDAVVELFGMPGDVPKSKGVETSTIGCGGLCLITDFKGEMLPGQVFHGHGTATYDPQQKKYVGSWTDSMATGMGMSQSTWDPATRTMTGTMEFPNAATGTIMKVRTTSVIKAGTRVFTMFAPGPDGKEMMTMRITYTRRP